jgi:CheY-like chemotaxis protein
MLTHGDVTVPDAISVYESVRRTGLRHVGFKDIGATPEILMRLCRRIREDGRTSYLEVVSVSAEAELNSIRAARDVGVDVVMGGTNVDAAVAELSGSAVRYFPFPGRVSGHPSILEGTAGEIALSAASMTERDGVHGLDLLAYRHAAPVGPIITAVVRATTKPVVVAGSVRTESQIKTLTSLGAWGFTIGGAVFDGALPAVSNTVAQVEWALAAARDALVGGAVE